MQKVRYCALTCPVYATKYECSLASTMHPRGGMKQLPELVGRTYRFSLAALRFYRKLPKSPDAQVPGVQLYKSSTSAWANYRSAQRGRSRAEFIAKLGTAVEESDEAVGWLEFMRDGEIGYEPGLLAEAKEICAMLTTALTNARRNTS